MRFVDADRVQSVFSGQDRSGRAEAAYSTPGSACKESIIVSEPGSV